MRHAMLVSCLVLFLLSACDDGAKAVRSPSNSAGPAIHRDERAGTADDRAVSGPGLKALADTPLSYSTRSKRLITLHPSGVHFEIPEAWVAYYSAHRDNLHLTRDELGEVEKGAHEWDTEFGEICNAALPFERCAAHVGSEGWGEDGHIHSDLQVRVYDLPGASDDLEDRVAKKAVALARPEELKRETKGTWHRVAIRYTRSPFDYSATATIDFRFRKLGARTIVLVFMHTNVLDSADKIPEILASVSAP